MTSFSLSFSHSQIAVFDPDLADPFNDWTDAHVSQGFAWRPGSVSFSTLEDGGQISIEVVDSSWLVEASSPAARIILVPFLVPQHRAVEIGSIIHGVRIELTAGHFELAFEHGRRDKLGLWAKFYFRPASPPIEPRIIRADSLLKVPGTLEMTARPA